MYAIVEIAGQQFKVEKGQQIFVNRLHEDPDGSRRQCRSHSVATPQRQQDYRFQEEKKKRISDF